MATHDDEFEITTASESAQRAAKLALPTRGSEDVSHLLVRPPNLPKRDLDDDDRDYRPEEAVDALIAEFDRLKAEPITEHELERAKNQFARDYILGRESNKDKAMQLAHALVIHKDIKSADGEFEIFQQLTTADIQRVARTYFTPANRLVLTLLPGQAGGR